MADANPGFAIRSVLPVGGAGAGVGATWTTLVAPNDCRRIVLRNQDLVNAVLLRTDFADVNTQDSIPAGLEFTIQMTDPASYFKAGVTICYFQPAAGALALLVKGFR